MASDLIGTSPTPASEADVLKADKPVLVDIGPNGAAPR